MIEKKIRFWLRGVYLTHSLKPICKAKRTDLNVFYLPHQRISQSIPFCIISDAEELKGGYHEELIRCVLVPVTTVYGQKGVRMYLHFTGLKPRDHINKRAVISWCYEKLMTSTYRRVGELYTPREGDLTVFQGTNGGRFCYTYSVFITAKPLGKPDLTNAFIHHKGVGACALARAAGGATSKETAGMFPTPAQSALGSSYHPE